MVLLFVLLNGYGEGEVKDLLRYLQLENRFFATYAINTNGH